MTPLAALHFKEWRVQFWKVFVGLLVLPVYFFSLLHGEGHHNAQAALVMIGLLAALFGAESVAEERRSGSWVFLNALPLEPHRLYLVKYGVGLAGLLMSVGGALLSARILLPGSAFTASVVASLLGLAVLCHALAFLVAEATRSAASGWSAAGATGLTAALAINPDVTQIAMEKLGHHLLLMGLAAAFLFLVYRFLLSSRLFAPLPDHPDLALINSDIRRGAPMLVIGGAAAFVFQTWLTDRLGLLPFLGLALWLGVSQVASDRESGHLSWLYALPLPPAKVLQAKHVAGFFLLLPLCLLIVLATAPLLGRAVVSCFLLFMAYGVAFIVASFASSRLFALAVILVAGYVIILHPFFILLALIAAPLLASPDWILELKRFWWPDKERARTRTSPWNRAAIPLLGLFMIPTAMAWDDWNCYLASDEAWIIPATAHWPGITGLDLLIQDTTLLIRSDKDMIEERSLNDPARIVAVTPFSTKRWEEYESAIDWRNAPPPVRNRPATPGRMEIMNLPTATSRDRMTVSSVGYVFEARATPFSLSGAPQPALVIRKTRLWFKWRSSWSAVHAWAVMPFLEETRHEKGRIYRAVAFDAGTNSVFLVGDGGLTMINLSTRLPHRLQPVTLLSDSIVITSQFDATNQPISGETYLFRLPASRNSRRR